MGDKVIIIDENDEEKVDADIEELERKERLNKLKKPKKKLDAFSLIMKLLMGFGLVLMFLSMLWQSGLLIGISLGIIIFSGLISYFFFK